MVSGEKENAKKMNDKEKDRAIALAQEISKYAFMLAFYLAYRKATSEVHHCRENLKRVVNELTALVL